MRPIHECPKADAGRSRPYAGVLWTFVAGGGFGAALVGLKVFPIVVIGGFDSVTGTIIGAMIVGLLESMDQATSVRTP